MSNSAFADDGSTLPTARLRQSYVTNEPPPVGLPTHFSVSTGGQAHSPLIGSLDRYPSRGILTPRKAWHSTLAVRGALLCSVCFLLTFAVIHGLRSGGPFSVSSNMAACEPSYDTLIPPLRRLKSGGSQHLLEHEDVMGALGELRPRIAMVTMADSRKMPMPRKLSYMTGIEEGTEVDILQVVWRNRKEYADRHGYTLVNGTDLVGDDRPPAWYKIKVVESVLNDFDWVFYLDSDAWITNPEIPLETLLPAQGGADFVVTEDAAGTNAGAWIVRSSDWSRAFLKEWWGLESFVRSGARAETRLRTGAQKGDTKSGDNDALKHIVREMDKATRARRVANPPQCALNSYLWRVSVRQWWRWLTAGSRIRSGIWRPGHLLVHLAGWNNYQGLMQLQRLLVNRHHFAQQSTQGHGGASRKLLQPPAWQQPPPTGWAGTTEDWRETLVQDGGLDGAGGIMRERVAADSHAVHFGSADDLVAHARHASGGAAGLAALDAPAAGDASPGQAHGSNDMGGREGVHAELDVIEEGDEMYEFQGGQGDHAKAGSEGEKASEVEGAREEELARHAVAEDGFGFASDYTFDAPQLIRSDSAVGPDAAGHGGDAADADVVGDVLVPEDFGVGGDVDDGDVGAELREDLPVVEAEAEDDSAPAKAVGARTWDEDEEKKHKLEETDRRIDEDVDVMLRLGMGTLRKAFWPKRRPAKGRRDDAADIVAARQAGDDGDYAVQGWVDAEPEPEAEDDTVDVDDTEDAAWVGQRAEERVDALADDGEGEVDYADAAELIEAAAFGESDEYEPVVLPPPPRQRPRKQMQYQRRKPTRSLRHRNAPFKLRR
eukprot:jgi/Ulvmu1/11757/UM008_0171.1